MVERGGFLRPGDREALDAFPAVIDSIELIQCFTLAEDDRALLASRSDPAAKLAGVLQIGALRLLGFVPRDLTRVPIEILDFASAQIDLPATLIAEYSDRPSTRAEHVVDVHAHLGFRRVDAGDLKRLADWLLEKALQHDKPTALFRLGCEHLRAEQIVRPGVTTIERAVVAARSQATAETYQQIAGQLSAARRAELDLLLEVDPSMGSSPLVWLRQEAPSSVAKSIKAQLEKIDVLRDLGAGEFDLDGLSPNRVRHLAGLGKIMTPQALRNTNPERRYQIVVATLHKNLIDRVDEVLELFDQAVSQLEAASKRQLDNELATNAKQMNHAMGTLKIASRAVADLSVRPKDIRPAVFGTVDHMSLIAAIETAEALHRDPTHLTFFCDRYKALRRFAPHVVRAFDFQAATTDDARLGAINYLKTIEQTYAKELPGESTPTDFASPQWRRHMTNSDGTIDRRAFEVCAYNELKGGLRGANLWVGNSFRYQDPTRYLISPTEWERIRADTPAETGISLHVPERLGQLREQISTETEAFNVAAEQGTVLRVEDEHATAVPIGPQDPLHDPETERLRSEIASLLPDVEIVDLLAEVNNHTGFLDRLTHAGNATVRSTNHQARLLAVIVALGCNIGIAKMARASGFTTDELHWTKTWYLRTQTAREANDTIVNTIIDQPITRHWGDGTLSSSDGQRFPMAVKHPRARRNRRYYLDKGATVYTWTSDRYAQYGTRFIPTTAREATHVLDAIFDNDTNLNIEEHSADTAGYTDIIFGLFDLVGLRFSPRIRDLADQRVWHLPGTKITGPAKALNWHTIKPDLITQRWDDMLRVAATIRSGHVPASAPVARLQSSSRQNELASAIKDYGKLPKTVSSLRYFHDETRRRRIGGQLNKSEGIHALRRQIVHANEKLTGRTVDDQDLHAECVTIITNANIYWNTIYTAHALNHIAQTRTIDDIHIARQATTSHEHINMIGRYNFTEPTTPAPGAHRPLKPGSDT